VSPEAEGLLEPGEVAFAKAPACLRTHLGSCVAITFWHPRLKLGAMCHYLVPERPGSEPAALNGKFAEDAIAMIAQRFRFQGLSLGDFEVKMFGGGNMFPDLPMGEAVPIGEKNAEAGRRLLNGAGFRVLREDLAGVGPRSVRFDLQSGEVWVHQGPWAGSEIPPAIRKRGTP